MNTTIISTGHHRADCCATSIDLATWRNGTRFHRRVDGPNGGDNSRPLGVHSPSDLRPQASTSGWRQGILRCSVERISFLWHRRIPLLVYQRQGLCGAILQQGPHQSGRKNAIASSTECGSLRITDRSSSRQIIWTWHILTSHWLGRYCDGNIIFKRKISTSTMFPKGGSPRSPGRIIAAMWEPHASQTRVRKEAEVTAILSALQPEQHLSDEVYDKIAAVHNSSVGPWGHVKCKLKLKDLSVSDRMISTFIRQCPCCQVMCVVQSIWGDPPGLYYSASLTCTVHTVHHMSFPLSHVDVSSSTYVLS